MEKEFTLEEIQQFYPKHAVIDTGHHFLIKDYFKFGDFKISAKIRKVLPLFKNGRPLLPTQPFHINETEFSVAIGTSTDCLHVQGWFGNFCDMSAGNPHPYISLGSITRATEFLAVAEYDQTQNWFRRGTNTDIKTAQNAIKFLKDEDFENGTGRDIWLISISAASVRGLWQHCVSQRQIIINQSEASLFPHFNPPRIRPKFRSNLSQP